MDELTQLYGKYRGMDHRVARLIQVSTSHWKHLTQDMDDYFGKVFPHPVATKEDAKTYKYVTIFGVPVVENPEVPDGEIWIVSPLDK